MAAHPCLYCDTEIVESARFGCRCGQRTDTARLSFRDVTRVGGACAVLFRDAQLSLPEHMVLAAYALSVRAVFLALVGPLGNLISATTPRPGEVYVFWAVWYFYFGRVASQFYAGRRIDSWIRGAVAAAIARVAIVA